MEKHETVQLLGMVSALDNREVTDLMIASWHGVLQRTTFVDARARMGTFYRSGATRRITVQDVVTPDVQPDDNAWMDRGTHAKLEPWDRYRQLRDEGKTRNEASIIVKHEYPDATIL